MSFADGKDDHYSDNSWDCGGGCKNEDAEKRSRHVQRQARASLALDEDFPAKGTYFMSLPSRVYRVQKCQEKYHLR